MARKRLKIVPHPRMDAVAIGDEVYSYRRHLFARVVEVFPAAVCVRVAVLSFGAALTLVSVPQLWRADDIELLSACRYCHGREGLQLERATGIPFRVCERCRVLPPEPPITVPELWW